MEAAMSNHDDEMGGGAPREEGGVATESEQEVKRPRLYKVLLHNDDYTTMEFVVLVLTSIFHHPEPEAVRIMLQVHQKGIGVAGVYSYEVAEARIAKVARLAREHEFPLRCSMEPE
jgi:ATP-dependent Clp protease adaptor protein ClpS